VNLNNLIFGPGSEYKNWLDDAYATLVKFPSEGEYFQMRARGWFSTPVRKDWGFVEYFFSFVFGPRSGIEGCVELNSMTLR
jgi:hypothetical protein